MRTMLFEHRVYPRRHLEDLAWSGLRIWCSNHWNRGLINDVTSNASPTRLTALYVPAEQTRPESCGHLPPILSLVQVIDQPLYLRDKVSAFGAT